MSNWISVKDKLPEHLHWVLGYDSDLKRPVCGYYDSLNKVWVMEHVTYENNSKNDITHWMPLPDAPICNPDSSCYGCIHNCHTFCDFQNRCLKIFGESDEETDERLSKD